MTIVLTPVHTAPILERPTSLSDEEVLTLSKAQRRSPLDRWSGDGYRGPANREALLHQERAWRVDINDGVRVNIAPLQLAGLLAGNVTFASLSTSLSAKDARKAIADRARWRADERRWVREGKLPRCGWMDESVPEGRRWTELAPEREAEHGRLEEKRKVVLKRLQGEGDDEGS